MRKVFCGGCICVRFFMWDVWFIAEGRVGGEGRVETGLVFCLGRRWW